MNGVLAVVAVVLMIGGIRLTFLDPAEPWEALGGVCLGASLCLALLGICRILG